MHGKGSNGRIRLLHQKNYIYCIFIVSLNMFSSNSKLHFRLKAFSTNSNNLDLKPLHQFWATQATN